MKLKKAKQEINFKIDIPADYHDLFDIFSEKNWDIVLSYPKHEDKILLNEK